MSLADFLHQSVENGVTPGVVAAYWSERMGSRVLHEGLRRIRINGLPELPMEKSSIFDLASLTKVISTSLLAHILIERNWLDLETKVTDFFPEFSRPDITIFHLLTHTSGLKAYVPIYLFLEESNADQSLETVPIEYRQKLVREFLISPDYATHLFSGRAVGEAVEYSDLGFLLLGFILEEIFQMPLDQAFYREIGQEEGLHFRRVNRAPFRMREDTYAATTFCKWRKELMQGQVEDENCYAMGGYGGHAGLFGTAVGVLRFTQKLMQGKWLSTSYLEKMWKRYEFANGIRTLGWDVPSSTRPSAGAHPSASTVGHLGFTGTSLWLDPVAQTISVLLTNRTHPTRDNPKIAEFRHEYHNLLAHEWDQRVSVNL